MATYGGDNDQARVSPLEVKRRPRVDANKTGVASIVKRLMKATSRVGVNIDHPEADKYTAAASKRITDKVGVHTPDEVMPTQKPKIVDQGKEEDLYGTGTQFTNPVSPDRALKANVKKGDDSDEDFQLGVGRESVAHGKQSTPPRATNLVARLKKSDQDRIPPGRSHRTGLVADRPYQRRYNTGTARQLSEAGKDEMPNNPYEDDPNTPKKKKARGMGFGQSSEGSDLNRKSKIGLHKMMLLLRLAKAKYKDDPEGWAKDKKLSQNFFSAADMVVDNEKVKNTNRSKDIKQTDKTTYGHKNTSAEEISLPTTEEKNDQQEEQLDMFSDEKKKAIMRSVLKAIDESKLNTKQTGLTSSENQNLKETQKIEGTKATWRAATGQPRKNERWEGGDNRKLRDTEPNHQGSNDPRRPPEREWTGETYTKNPKMGYNPKAAKGRRGSDTGETTFTERESDKIIASGYKRRPLYQGENRNNATVSGVSPTSASVRGMRDKSREVRSKKAETKTDRQQEIQRRLPDAKKRGTLRQAGEKRASRQKAERQEGADRRARTRSMDALRAESKANKPSSEDRNKAAKMGLQLMLKARQQRDGKGVDPSGKNPSEQLDTRNNLQVLANLNTDLAKATFVVNPKGEAKEKNPGEAKNDLANYKYTTESMKDMGLTPFNTSRELDMRRKHRGSWKPKEGSSRGPGGTKITEEHKELRLEATHIVNGEALNKEEWNLHKIQEARLSAARTHAMHLAMRTNCDCPSIEAAQIEVRKNHAFPLTTAEKPGMVMRGEPSAMYGADGKALEEDPMARKIDIRDKNDSKLEANTRSVVNTQDSQGRITTAMKAEPTICSSLAVFNSILNKTEYDDKVVARQGKAKRSKRNSITNSTVDTAAQQINDTRGI